MLYFSLLPISLILSLGFIDASPINSISVRQIDMDCNNPAAVFVSDCWTYLGLSDYLNNAQTGWNQTTPTCSDSSRCCLINEPWSTCFLRLGRGLGGADCTTMDDQPCTWDNAVSPYLDPKIAPYVRYTVKSIYGVHDFFSSYYKALQYATTQTALMITPLTNAIDPDSDSLLGLTACLFVLSFGLSFLTAPTVAIKLFTLSNSLKYASQNFALSLQQAPAVARTIWPAGGDASRTFQISQLDTQLSNATIELAEILDRGLKLLMTDMPTFVAFAQSGAYCGNDTVDIAAKTEGLDLALRTYVTSVSMKQNGWYAVPLRYSSPEEYKNLTDSAATVKGWRRGPTVIDKLWYSTMTTRLYSLENGGSATQYLPKDLINDIETYGWANLPTLFDGSYNCTRDGRAGSEQDLLQVQFDGELNLDCISQIPILVPCSANCPEKLPDGSCPFGFTTDCNDASLSNIAAGLPPDRQQPGFVNPPADGSGTPYYGDGSW